MLPAEMISILPDEILQKILNNSSLSNSNVINFSLSSKKILKNVIVSMLREFVTLCDKNEEYIILSEHIGGNQMDYNIFYEFIVDHGKIKIPTNLDKYPMMRYEYPQTEIEAVKTEYQKVSVSSLYDYLYENVPMYGVFQSISINPGEYRDEKYVILSKAVCLLSILNKIEQYSESSDSQKTIVNSSGGRQNKKTKPKQNK
jgi:hypothetical protein